VANRLRLSARSSTCRRSARVSDAIRSLNLTRIIIAHRAETIASAERVIVLQAGRVGQDLRRVAAG
jgi:ATP-binding cassette, subfamily B, bacterial CvaB/MchF/RaxB